MQKLYLLLIPLVDKDVGKKGSEDTTKPKNVADVKPIRYIVASVLAVSYTSSIHFIVRHTIINKLKQYEEDQKYSLRYNNNELK